MLAEPTTRHEFAFWGFVISILAALALLLWMTNNSTLDNLLLLAAAAIGVLVVVRHPMVGLGLVIASTALVESLPQVPLVSSVIPLIGGFTLLVLLARNRNNKFQELRLSPTELLGLLLFSWVFFSNPGASMFGNDRSWIFTFAQLWLLLWMARRFVSSEHDHRKLMAVIVLGIFISAIIAVQETSWGIGLVERATGLSGGANTIARYCVFGILLLNYFQNYYRQQPTKRLFILAGIVIFLLALLATGSRTGLILLVVAFIFIAHHFLIHHERILVLWLFFAGGLVWLLIQTNGSILDPAHIVEAVLTGTDTVGARYDFWRAGWDIWLDHPILGIGIGQFRNYLPTYWRSPQPIIAMTPHNTYIQVLSETGIVGLLIFLALIFSVVKGYWTKAKTLRDDFADIYWTWLAITIVLLAGAMTKTDLVDKFLWVLFGLSATSHHEPLK